MKLPWARFKTHIETIGPWAAIHILLMLPSMILTSVVEIDLARQGQASAIPLLNLTSLPLGFFTTYLVANYREKIEGFVPFFILGEVLGIIFIFLFSFTDSLSLLFIGNAIMIQMEAVRVTFIEPAIRQIAQNAKMDDQKTMESLSLFVYISGMVVSLLYTLIPLYVAAIIAGTSNIVAAILLSRIPFPQLLPSEKGANGGENTTSIKPIPTKWLVATGVGVWLALQTIITIRAVVSDSAFVTNGFYTTFYLAAFLGLPLATYLKKREERTFTMLLITRASAALLFIILGLALVVNGFWILFFGMYLAVILEQTAFHKLIFQRVDDKVLAKNLIQRYYLGCGLAANTLFWITLTWFQDQLQWVLWGLVPFASLSLIALLLKKDWFKLEGTQEKRKHQKKIRNRRKI